MTPGGTTAKGFDPRWAYVLVNLSTLLWATNVALGRLLRQDIGPFTLAAARFTIAALVYSIVVARWGSRTPVAGRQWLPIIGMGLTGVFGFSSLLYAGLRDTTATNGALINGSGPLVIGILATVFLGERFGLRGVVGALLSLAGVIVVVSNGSLAVLTGQQINEGDVLVLLAVGAWGAYSICTRVATRSRSALEATWLSTLCGLPLLYAAAVWEAGHRLPTLSSNVLLAVLYIGLFPTVIAYLTWNQGVRGLGPGKAAAFYNMLPVFGALVGALFLGEHFGPPQLLGGGLIITGGLVAAWDDLRRGPTGGAAKKA